MVVVRFLISFGIVFFLVTSTIHAQDSTTASIPKQDSSHEKQAISVPDITISYSVTLKSPRKSTGIRETYNGGVKTLFISGNRARVRLVSLMRTQSIFILPSMGTTRYAVIAKESGNKRYKSYLSKKQWDYYNRRYDSVTCTITDDSISVLEYPCRKAIIHLKDGRHIIAYYTDSLKNGLIQKAEPVFRCIPGIVLKYEFSHKKGTIEYTATSIIKHAVSPYVFKIPVKGYITRKVSFKPVKGITEGLELDEDENDEPTQQTE